ncbi:MAG TPA: MarR family transcriptional regulator [Mycobacteriales bacterium]
MTPGVPTPSFPDLSRLLSHTSRVLTSQMTAAFTEIGISPRAYCVLFHAMEAERTQIQLAEVCDLDKTTMVVTIDELERAGLARRRPSDTDRRARIISVTEAGERIVAEGAKAADRVHGDLLAAVPAGEREAFVNALSRLVEGHLSTPAECDRPVRRTRQARVRTRA